MIDLDKLVLGQLTQTDGFCRYVRGDCSVATSEITINDLGTSATLTEMTTSGALKISSGSAQDSGIEPTVTQVTGAVKASGYITFSVNPMASDTITMYGTAFTFVDSDAAGNQINIGDDLSETLVNTVTVLNASVVTNVAKATYSTDGVSKLNVVFDNYGTGGNSYTLAASAATPSGGNLTGGANGVGSIAFVNNLFVGDVLTINGTEFTIVASGATGNQVDINTTLSGTIDNIVTVLNASAVVGVALATYSKTGSDTTLTATYDDSALSGSAYTLAASTVYGTGARTVRVTGLDADWNIVTDDVSLNGQTAVSLTNVVLHPFLIQVLTAGSGGTNAGVLYVGSGTVTSGVPAVINLGCAASVGQSRTAFMPIPKGYRAIVKQVAGNMDAAGKILAKFKPFGGVYWLGMGLSFGSTGGYAQEDILTPALPAKTLIKFTGVATSSATARASANIIFKKD